MKKKHPWTTSLGGVPYLTKDHAQNGLGIAFAAVIDVPPPDAPPLPSLSDESDDVRRLPNVIFQVLVGRALVRQPSKPNPVLGEVLVRIEPSTLSPPKKVSFNYLNPNRTDPGGVGSDR